MTLAKSKSFLPAFLLALAIISSPFSAKGQGFAGGVTAGITASQISGDNLAGFHKAGFQAGFYTRYRFNDKLAFQAEFDYIQKGSRKNYDPEDLAFPFYLLRLNYVEMPFLLRYYHKKFVFEGGLSIGGLVSSLEEDVSGEIPPTIPFKRIEIAAQAGIGTRITDRLFMVWRYSNSVLPVRDHSGGVVFRFNRGQYISMLEFLFQYDIKSKK